MSRQWTAADWTAAILIPPVLVVCGLIFSAVLADITRPTVVGTGNGTDRAAEIMAERSAERDREMMEQFQALLTEYKARADAAGIPWAALIWGSVAIAAMAIGGAIALAVIRSRQPDPPPAGIGFCWPDPAYQIRPPDAYFTPPARYADPRFFIDHRPEPLRLSDRTGAYLPERR